MGPLRISRLSLQLFFSDLLLTLLGLYLASYLRSALPIGLGGALPAEVTALPFPAYLLAAASWAVALGLSGAYDPGRALRWYSEAGRVALGAVLGTVLLAGALFMTYRETSRLQFIYFFGASLTLLLTYRTALRILYIAFGRIRPGGRGRVLILGAGELGRTVGKVILDHSRWGFELAGFLDDDVGKHSQQFSGVPVLGKLDAVGQVIHEQAIDEVWIALPPRAHDRLYSAVAALETYPVHIKVVPDYFSLALVKARAEILGGIPVIGLREPIIEGAPRLLKRAFDLVVGIVLLVIAAPFVALIGLGIRLNSPGPPVFAQKRYGENGRIFDMYKFRTMIGEAVASSEPVMPSDGETEVSHKRREDPRVTRVGRFLRRWSLDELPQLINVIRGDMSLVGPRPELPLLVDRYKPWQRKRFAVPQGITGWWQINGRSDKPMHLNTQDDLYYVYNYSLWLDILILVRTPLAVLKGKGAF